MQAGQARVNQSIIDFPCCGKRANESIPEGGRVVVAAGVGGHGVSFSANDPNLRLCVCVMLECVNSNYKVRNT